MILKKFKKTLYALSIFALAYSFAEASAKDNNKSYSTLETIHTFSQNTPPANIAISPTGRIFLSVHAFYGEPKYRVLEVLEDGSTKPYPSITWSSAPKEKGPGLADVLGIVADQEGILWMLDGQTEKRNGRIVGWDIKREKHFKTIILQAPTTTKNSFLNDLAIDRKHNKIYVADSSGALIIVDIESGKSRRILDNSPFTTPENINMVIDDKLVTLGGQAAKIGVNPITIDAKNEWLYFAPMSATSMYRINTKDLLNTKLSEKSLHSKVERYGDKTISDGSVVDSAGNVYITSITDDSIGVTNAMGKYQTLFQHDDISWADGFAIGADGYIYFTVNELHRSPVLNEGKRADKGEFKIMRFAPLAKAEQGR